MKKLSVLLSFLILFCLFPLAASAEEPSPVVYPVTGSCGSGIEWSLSDSGLLTLTGSGDMKTYEYTAAPWYEYRNSIVAVTVSDGISSLGSYAFASCLFLQSVSLPDSLSALAPHAFDGCILLESISLPAGITAIPSGAFRGCDSLSAISMPGVVDIGDYAFSSCRSLRTLSLPDTVETIGEAAFSGCSGLTAVSLPDGLLSLGSFAFHDCGALTSAVIPEKVVSVKEYTFANCINLQSVTLPDGLVSLGESVFWGCISLQSISLPAIPAIPDLAFYGCTRLSGITLPDSVFSIGDSAFSYCQAITDIAFPESLLAIGESAFSGSGLCSVALPDRLLSLGDSAFAFCHSLKSADAGSLRAIPSDTFAYCENLESIVISEKTVSVLPDAFTGCTGLTDVYYLGSEWAAVSVAGSSPLNDAAIHTGVSADQIVHISCLPCEHGALSVKCSALVGETVTVTPLPDSGYKLSALLLNGEETDSLTFTAEKDTTVSAVFVVSRAGGSCGDGLSWEIDENGVLTITGSGPMHEYGRSALPWDSHRNVITEVRIDGTVTSLSEYAFFACKALSRIVFDGSRRDFDKMAKGLFSVPPGVKINTLTVETETPLLLGKSLSLNVLYAGVDEAQTVAAFYDENGRMLSVSIFSGSISEGLNELSVCPPAEYAYCTFMMVDTRSLRPLCSSARIFASDS